MSVTASYISVACSVGFRTDLDSGPPRSSLADPPPVPRRTQRRTLMRREGGTRPPAPPQCSNFSRLWVRQVSCLEPVRLALRRASRPPPFRPASSRTPSARTRPRSPPGSRHRPTVRRPTGRRRIGGTRDRRASRKSCRVTPSVPPRVADLRPVLGEVEVRRVVPVVTADAGRVRRRRQVDVHGRVRRPQFGLTHRRRVGLPPLEGRRVAGPRAVAVLALLAGEQVVAVQAAKALVLIRPAAGGAGGDRLRQKPALPREIALRVPAGDVAAQTLGVEPAVGPVAPRTPPGPPSGWRRRGRGGCPSTWRRPSCGTPRTWRPRRSRRAWARRRRGCPRRSPAGCPRSPADSRP